MQLVLMVANLCVTFDPNRRRNNNSNSNGVDTQQ